MPNRLPDNIHIIQNWFYRKNFLLRILGGVTFTTLLQFALHPFSGGPFKVH